MTKKMKKKKLLFKTNIKMYPTKNPLKFHFFKDITFCGDSVKKESATKKAEVDEKRLTSACLVLIIFV